MIFSGMQKTSTLDFPGILSCVLFTQGCNLNCFYCHNPQLISPVNHNQGISVKEVFDFLEKRKGLLDGVVISGGEPTLHPDLFDLLWKIRKIGFKIKLDTNGQKPDVVGRLLQEGLLDCVGLDIKALKKDYLKVCGKDGFSLAKQTLTLLENDDCEYEVRTTLYPGMTIMELTALLRMLPPLKRWRLNFFRMPLEFKAEATERLSQYAITETDIKKRLNELLLIQPNLTGTFMLHIK